MGAGGSTPIAAPFATFATWTAGSCAALVKEYKDKDYDFGIDLPTVEALTGLDKALAEGIVASLTRSTSEPRLVNALSLLAGICLVGEAGLSAADRASLVYDIFDFDTRREISKDEMTILLLCTVRAAKVVAGAGEDPSDDIMEATTAAAFEKHAARLDVIKKDEFVAWAAEETKVVDSLAALLIKFGSLKGELPAAPAGERYNTLLPSPAGAKYALAVVQFKVPGHPNGGSDKGPDGNRIDSIPIANGVIKAGGACDMLLYDYTDHAGFDYEPSDPLYRDLLTKLTTDIKNGLMDVLDLKGEALPLLWTCDYIPKNPEGWSKTENACDMETEYVVGEFNCSCVGVSQFQAVCGGERTLADVPDADYAAGTRLADLMGRQAIRMLVRPAPRGRNRRSIVAEPADVLEQAEEADGCEELEPIDNSSCLRSHITYDAPFDYGCCGSQFFPGIF